MIDMTNTLKLQHVRAQAEMLGVKHHHRAGIAKIQQLIDDHLIAQNSELIPEPAAEAAIRTEPVVKGYEKIIPMSEAEYKKETQREAKTKISSLLRVRITCLDPHKKNWPGELISVGSAKLGTFKRYIPFDTEEPWHIPKIIYDVLSERMCSVPIKKKDARGHKTTAYKQIKAYSITIEEPMTAEELKELATQQALAGGLD
jgi:hypothetical protein